MKVFAFKMPSKFAGKEFGTQLKKGTFMDYIIVPRTYENGDKFEKNQERLIFEMIQAGYDVFDNINPETGRYYDISKDKVIVQNYLGNSVGASISDLCKDKTNVLFDNQPIINYNETINMHNSNVDCSNYARKIARTTLENSSLEISIYQILTQSKNGFSAEMIKTFNKSKHKFSLSTRINSILSPIFYMDAKDNEELNPKNKVNDPNVLRYIEDSGSSEFVNRGIYLFDFKG